MQRVLLFSIPTPEILSQIEPLLFPNELSPKRFAYMPSDGASPKNAEFIPLWEGLAQKHNAEFVYIDNSVIDATAEIKKLKSCNILMITGGPTFTLLRNLKRNGMDQALRDFCQQKDFVISGFSAGAIVLCPTIEVVTFPWKFGPDSNEVGITDLTGLGVINFEIVPHYNSEFDAELLKSYSSKKPYEVKPISNSEYLCFELS